MKTKIKEIKDKVIIFENGYELSSEHERDCCEDHYLDFTHIDKNDYEDLEFDLTKDDFFTRIPEYGIQLNATNNFPLRIPGYGFNNGYYSDNLTLILTDNFKESETFDITKCQEINGDC